MSNQPGKADSKCYSALSVRLTIQKALKTLCRFITGSMERFEGKVLGSERSIGH
jgi:hypothetical protein